MEIGINIGWRDIDIDAQIEYMKKYGFTTAMLNSEESDEHMEKLVNAEIKIESLHAPFSKINTLWQNGNEGDEFLEKIIDSVKKCARWNAPVLVVHISSGVPAPMVNDIGISRFNKLMEVADKYNITIAYENQRMLGNIALFMEYYPQAGFCWDVGHEACFAYGREYMPLFGKRIVEVHIHDNMGVYNEDLHLLPYDGKIDFERVAKQIASTDYSGSVMLEVNGTNKCYEELTDDEYYARAAASAKKLADRIEEIRNS